MSNHHRAYAAQQLEGAEVRSCLAILFLGLFMFNVHIGVDMTFYKSTVGAR